MTSLGHLLACSIGPEPSVSPLAKEVVVVVGVVVAPPAAVVVAAAAAAASNAQTLGKIPFAF
jgi:hypothetical protein